MSKPQKYWALVPATGSGQRMGADRPKQYLPLGDKTIIETTLGQLLDYPPIEGVILVLNENDSEWQSLGYQHTKPIILCEGGNQRHHSVYNGLLRLKQEIVGNPFVLIHDAVRPFVQHADLDRLLKALGQSDDGALLGTSVSDTLKQCDKNGRVLDTQCREGLWRAFTPQAFPLDKIFMALQQVIEKNLTVTDDASAMELAGYQPLMIKSDSRNIKITHPEDLQLAQLLLQRL